MDETRPVPYFYELDEADDDLFTDVLLAHEREYDEEEMLELVLAARARVLETFEEDSLAEAIARDLERRHGFTVVDDRQIRVAIHVSAEEGETRVVGTEERSAEPAGDPDELFRTLVLDVDKEDRRWGDR